MVLIGLLLFQNLAWEGHEPSLVMQSFLHFWLYGCSGVWKVGFSALVSPHTQLHYVGDMCRCTQDLLQCRKKNFRYFINEDDGGDDDVLSSLFHSLLQITGKFLASSRTECLFFPDAFLALGKTLGIFFSFSFSRNL